MPRCWMLMWNHCPALGEGATAAGPSAPTVNLNVIIDVSVPVRKKTGCCEQSGLPCPQHLLTLRRGPAPAATSVPSVLTCLRALLSPCSPVRLLTASCSPHRERILQRGVCSTLAPLMLHMDGGPILGCGEPQTRLRRGPAPAHRAVPPAAPEQCLAGPTWGTTAWGGLAAPREVAPSARTSPDTRNGRFPAQGNEPLLRSWSPPGLDGFESAPNGQGWFGAGQLLQVVEWGGRG